MLSTIVFVHAWSPTWTQTPVPGTGYWAQVAPWSWLTSSGGQLTCDTVSTYHITDNARDPQRGLSRATYLLKVSRRAAVPNEEES